MAKLRIPHLPDGTYRELERRAARRDMTVADYVLKLIERDQRRPLAEEWLAELRTTSEGVDFEVAKVEVARDLTDADGEGAGARPRR